MPSLDTSRHLLDTRLHYTTALMQQGRVLTDADWNEMVQLESEDRRQIIAETVCTEGSPNDGFKIGTPTALAVDIYPGPPAKQNIQSYDFTFGAGSFYLGGYRFTCNPAEQAETFASQMDWMSMAIGTGNFPSLPTAARTDIAYLYGWHDTVSSTEDQEFRERALGGPDTTVRVRRMRRVQVLPGTTATNCAEARAALKQSLIQPRPGDTGGPHSFSDEGTELLSKTRLTVSFVTTGADGDPCKPSQVRGFIGAENQAIRVQLTTAKRFIWGIDNAAPLYRVQVDASDPSNKTLKFLTLPRDQASMPLLGQAIELLPWGSHLANNEKAADSQGFVTAIDGTYDPDHQTVLLHDAVPANMIQWLADQPASLDGRFDPSTQKHYFYARVWTGGADQDFTPGTAVTLPDTGLAVTFGDFGIPGDYWIIAARPNTPDQLVPWRLLDGAAPHGPRRFYTALALINWTVPVGGGAAATVRDCRERFRSLCRNNGCCQVIVGDGTSSFGDFTSIQAAINSLPPEGGEVCVLRGRYPEPLTLTGLTDVVIHGCGNDTVIVPPAGATAAIAIDGSQLITLRNFAVEAPTMVGVAVLNRSSGITLRGLKLTARDQSAVIAKVHRGLVVEQCVLQAQPLVVDLAPGGTVGVTPLLYVAGTELRVELNRIEADMSGTSRRTALGGMQVGGGSSDVEIRRNLIRGGNGIGIVLGSIRYVQAGAGFEDDGSSGTISLTGWFWYYDPNNCVFIWGDPGQPPDGNGNLVPVSEGNLDHVLIIENRIEQMGQSGIAPPLLFFPERSPDLITISELAVLANTIWTCMRLEVGPISVANLYKVAFGGIILPDVEVARIERNVIEEVGTEARDAICGIFAVLATGIAIRENRLRHNGREAVADQPVKLGFRGGIILPFVITPTETLSSSFLNGERQDGMDAAVVHDNVVVSREGRALQIGGIGPLSITDNQLTAHGTSILALIQTYISLVTGHATTAGNFTRASSSLTPSSNVIGLLLDVLGGSAVLVIDLAFSNEIYLQMLGLDSVGDLPDPARRELTYFVGGNVLFSDNQVTYDALDQIFAFSLCAVLLFSLDTVTLTDNQIECDLLLSFVIINTLVVGFSTQVTGNRWTEGILNAYLSAFTLGIFMNSTALNTATHCVLTAGAIEPAAVDSGGNVVDLRLNLVLTDPLLPNPEGVCAVFKRGLAQLDKSLGAVLSSVLHIFNL